MAASAGQMEIRQNDGFLMVSDLLTWRISSCSVEFIATMTHGRADAQGWEC
jgi:hypothetical protein